MGRSRASPDDQDLDINVTIHNKDGDVELGRVLRLILRQMRNTSEDIAEIKGLLMSLMEDVAVLTSNVEEVRVLVNEVSTAITTKDVAQDAALAEAQAEVQRLLNEGAVTADQVAALQASLDQMAAEQAPVVEAIAAANAGLDAVDESLRTVRDSQNA
jgi:prefoldin subunit 5